MIDETGLTGRYDIKIDVSAYMESMGGGDSKGDGQLDVTSVLLNALQQQLGVKLESKKESVDVLVVDHVDKTPVAN